jgi:hypothetical protein
MASIAGEEKYVCGALGGMILTGGRRLKFSEKTYTNVTFSLIALAIY